MCFSVFFVVVVVVFFVFFFVFFSWHHSDQISAGSEVSKVMLCVQILQCHRPRLPMVGMELPWQLKSKS